MRFPKKIIEKEQRDNKVFRKQLKMKTYDSEDPMKAIGPFKQNAVGETHQPSVWNKSANIQQKNMQEEVELAAQEKTLNV